MLERFLPPAIASGTGPGALDVLRRARILVVGSLACLAVSLVLGVHRMATEGPGAKTWVMVVSAAVFAMPLFLLRRTGSLSVSAAIIPSGLLVLLPYDAYQNGGLAPASMTAMLAVPLIAGFFLGAKSGFVYAVVLEVEVIALVVLTRSGFVFPPSLDLDRTRMMAAVAVCALLPFVAGLAALFDRTRALMTNELQASERRYAVAAQETNDGMFEWHLASDQVEVSRRYRDLLGQTGGERRSFDTFTNDLHAMDRAVFVADLRRLTSDGGELIAECRLHDAKGDTVWVDVRAYLDRTSDDAPRAVLGTIRDATVRRKVELLKNDFVSTVSHELRTPLTAVLGSLALLKEGVAGELPEEAQSLVVIAQDNGLRLLRLVGDLLDIQKLEAGALEMRPERVDLVELVRRSLLANRDYAARLGVKLELAEEASADSVSVHADPERVLQVLANLLSNGAKFSRSGESVEVRVHCHEGFGRVEVEDHGVGISPDFAPRVFAKFAQADGGDTRSTPGTGLGLSIAKALVEQMGGDIAFRTEAGKGTTFSFRLPLVSPS